MISIDIWRAQIGGHYLRTYGWKAAVGKQHSSTSTLIRTVILHFLVCVYLLVIGCVETNPGPEYDCHVCPAKLPTLGQHAHHQRIHLHDCNFNFRCGICIQNFTSFENLTSHISKSHRSVRRERDVATSATFVCVYCSDEQKFLSIVDLCHHLIKEHVGKPGVDVTCPLSYECEREKGFSTSSAFSTHLSKYHPTWRERHYLSGNTRSSRNVQSMETLRDVGRDVPNTDDDIDEEFLDAEDTYTYKESDVLDFISDFYIMLEVDCLLPVSTVGRIATTLTTLSEMIHSRMRTSLASELLAEGLPKDKIDHILLKLISADPLYLAHHGSTSGPDFTSAYKRRRFTVQENPSPPILFPTFDEDRPIDGERYAYVPIKSTLSLLLQDPSIQAELQESFQRNAIVSGSILKDYTDGEVCINRNLPSKRIDLLLFQDGFSCTSMLTTTQQKHKVLGSYMTIGNLKPWKRTQLQSLHFVLMALEAHVKKYRQKCFSKLVADLKELEGGIDFLNEKIPVYLQFIIGDNLGSHFLGGFVESFSSSHYCRYCDISKEKVKETPTAVKQLRTPASYKSSALKARLKNLKHHRGVKENSVFNELRSYNICDPGLPPCLGHDLFHGFADMDLKKIIDILVKKKWFSYDFFNRRISEFYYATSDAKNKPAPLRVNKEKKKRTTLGGSAVQNWLLLRLLPLIIQDKIVNENDPVWKLYLKLKSACEIVCAPAVSLDQIDALETIIQSYIEDRKILRSPFIPKHHYFLHYPTLMRKFGPLIHLWGMRFEQRHQFFKHAARAANNFKNLILTLANKCQLLFLYEQKSARWKDSVIVSNAFPIKPDHFSPDIQSFVNAQKFTLNLQGTERLEVNGIRYKVGDLLLIGKTSASVLQVAEVLCILLDNGIVNFLLREKIATLNEGLGLYFLSETDVIAVSTHTDLKYPCPQPVYCYGENECFSLKHSIC